MMESDTRFQELAALAERLGIVVGNADLFDRALTHSSRVAEEEGVKQDYESLEFLGDAVLSLAVAHYLYESYPDRTPGEYSRMRADVVSRRSLARAVQVFDLASVIRLGKGEEKSGGRHRDALLADCMESLIAALYLDSGWESARSFVARTFEDELRRAGESNRVWDFKSRLQNYCQGEHIGLPKFVLVSSEGPDHKKEFEIEVHIRNVPAGRGRGSSKKEAEQQAARAALEAEGQHFE